MFKTFAKISGLILSGMVIAMGLGLSVLIHFMQNGIK